MIGAPISEFSWQGKKKLGVDQGFCKKTIYLAHAKFAYAKNVVALLKQKQTEKRIPFQVHLNTPLLHQFCN